MPYVGVLNCTPLDRRKRGKHSWRGAPAFARAWRWYVRGHVVSRSAVRLIRQVLMQIPSDSKEGPPADLDVANDAELEPLPTGADVDVSPAELRGLLRAKGSGVDDSGTSKLVQAAMAHGHGLWDSVCQQTGQYTKRKDVYCTFSRRWGTRFGNEAGTGERG